VARGVARGAAEVADGETDPIVAESVEAGAVVGAVASETICWSWRVMSGNATASATSSTTSGTVTRTAPGILGFKLSSGA
jgi:hypothetical protein